MKKGKREKRQKRKRINCKISILYVAFFACLIFFVISIIDIVKWSIASKKTDIQVEELQKNVKVEEISNPTEVEVISQIEELPKSNPYWDYIQMNLINVNFEELKEKNNQTKGWIQVNGTNVNYPFVQSSDNDYYLKHSFDKSYNSAGWVYLDYRNNIGSLGKNTILYAHKRVDKTMFGTLKNMLSSEWLNNTNNHVIKLSTETENTLWQVFSIYHIPTTSDYLKIDFGADEEFKEFADMLINRSAYKFNTTINKTDNILTLSTCYNSTEKLVVHAKLIKKGIR